MSQESKGITQEEKVLSTDSEVYRLNLPTAESNSMHFSTADLAQSDALDFDETPSPITVPLDKVPYDKTLLASVRADGTLIRGVGSDLAKRFCPGCYEVLFCHKVIWHFYLATIASNEDLYTPSGEITVVKRANNPNGVWVVTRGSDGYPADRTFHLALFPFPV
jgi:hypothetical protein